MIQVLSKGDIKMRNDIQVAIVHHPREFIDRQELLSSKLNEIENCGGTILYITSDSEGYTIIYRKNTQLNG